MKCNYDCLHCQFSDCIKDEKQALYNPEVKRSYYQRHKAERLAYQKRYNATKDRHEERKTWYRGTEGKRTCKAERAIQIKESENMKIGLIKR